MAQKASAPRPNTMASVLAGNGPLLPWPWPPFFSAAAAAGLAAGLGAAGASGGAGQVISPSLITVRPRIASSPMLTLMTPSLVLHSSSVRRNRLVPYRVDDWRAMREARSV